MADGDDLKICTKHVPSMTYRASTCPWCDLIASVKKMEEIAYKKGYAAGMQKAKEIADARNMP